MPAVTFGMIGAAALSAGGAAYSGSQSARSSRTNYQRRYRWTVEDLRKAGLNPMLAVQNPVGQAAQPEFPNIGESAAEGLQKGSAAAVARQQGQLIKAQTNSARAQGNLLDAQGVAQNMENIEKATSESFRAAAAQYDPDTGAAIGTSAYSAEKTRNELDLVRQQGRQAAASADLAEVNKKIAEGELTLQEVRVKYADELAKIEVAYREAMKKAAELNIPVLQAEAAFWSSAGVSGKVAQFLKQILGGIR